jgi:hypothetical protein
MRFPTLIALACLAPGTALAVGEGESSLSAGGGVAVLFQGQSRTGVAAEFRLLRGISDAWSARLGLQAAVAPSSQVSTATLFSQAVGVTWAYDVVNWVPFADFGLVVADVRGGGHAASQRAGAQAGAGIDYLMSRQLVASFLGRVDYYPLRLAGADVPRPVQLSFVLHLGRTF